jgi:probable F420-dependent oxidoreductase
VVLVPTLSVGLPNFGTFLPPDAWHRLVDLGRAADDAGIDRVVVVDHVVMGPHTDAYAWGTFPTPPEAPWLEPMTVLTAIAAATTNVRLATGIIIAPLRPAVLLAKQAATLDVLSQGRLDLGVGAGWQREEYEAEGLDFDKRGQLLTDTIAACKVLWRDTPAAITTPSFSFEDVYCEPKPVQEGGVPLWISGTLHRRNLERLARHGDAWIPIMGESVDGIESGIGHVREAFTAAGRDPVGLRVQAPLRLARGADGALDLGRSMESVPALVAVGATDIQVPLQAFTRDPDAAPGVLAEIGAAFRAVAEP